MSVELDKSKEEDHVARVRQKCVKCFKGPNLIKTVVALACTGVLLQQIVVCIQKLCNIPVTTHTHFDYNKSIVYPSITFCREPPYKLNKLEKYELYSHPRYTSTWREFNFSSVTLDQLWQEVTYDQDEVFVQFGLDQQRDNVKVISTLGFVTGQCYTLTPRDQEHQAGKERGYSVLLQHDSEDLKNPTTVLPPGYHVHIHYEKEPYTEVNVYNGGLVDYVYVNTGETLDVKLTVNEYVMISDEDNPCTNAVNYSANQCTTRHVWSEVGREAGCSGPWMESELQRCDNFQEMRNLISSYMSKHLEHEHEGCPRICRSLLYNAFVTDRQKDYIWDAQAKLWSPHSQQTNLQTQIYIYFNNMMVSVFEEKYNYDWNLFVADLGGSVGFLLGLSVIGLINIMHNVWCNVLRPLLCRRKLRKSSEAFSDTTLEVKNVY